MKDYLVKALAFDGEVRAYSVRTTNMVSEAQRRHDTWRTASACTWAFFDSWCNDGGHVKRGAKINN
ncbi:Hsp33 family molecular chaperone HslO [Bacillus cytotoxicus]